MKIEIEVMPAHYWIERRDWAKGSEHFGKEAEAVVRFRGDRDGEKYDHEEHYYGTPEECIEFVRKYFPADK